MLAMQSKQKTLHSASVIWSCAPLYCALWAFCIVEAGELALPTASQAQTVPSALGDEVATLRLIAAPGPHGGTYAAALDIVMAPGSHTYWQQPGEAGVPPVFAFNGSENVAKAVVQYPAPARISEEGIEAFGYTDQVVFPVVVTPIDATKPAVLKADVTYAVCNKICIPAHGNAAIDLRPGSSGVDGGKVIAALADVPVPASALERRDLILAPDKGGAKPSWTVTWSGAVPIDDLFAVAPEGFYFETKKLGPNHFLLTAAQVVSASKTTSVPVSLTLARKGMSLVATEILDLAVATR